MLFTDMKCFSCGNPPPKATLRKGEKLGVTGFSADKDGLLEIRPSEGYVIHLCDPCLTEGGRKGRVHRTVQENRPPNFYEYTWNPDGDDEHYMLPPPVFIRPQKTDLCGTTRK